jgi:LysM repeat protein
MNRALEGPRGFLLGFLAALVSAIIVLGGFLLALTEGGQRIAFLPSPSVGSVRSPDRTTSTPTDQASPIPTTPPATPAPGQPTFTASPTLPASDTPPVTSSQASSTVAGSQVPCAATPPGWIKIIVSAGETLESLASRYGIDAAELAAANCFPPGISGNLQGDTDIFVPPVQATATLHPTATQKPKTTFVCSAAPSSWVPYVVKKGENLFRIALRYGVSTWTLQYYNCIPNPNRILAGQVIRVPYVATLTPTPSDTPPPTEIPTSTFTATNPPPTAVPPTATFTWTPSPTPLPSPTFTASPAPSATPSATPLPTSSPTVAPTATDTLTPALLAPSGSPPPRPTQTP